MDKVGGLNERSRIGGKGMTHEQYIVRNCPAFNPQAYEHCCSLDGNYKCEYCTDCVIKQAIDKCKYYQNKIGRAPQYRAGFVDATNDILQLFDIEEINK